MRNELLQERASRQDLECDKAALERQVHANEWEKPTTHNVPLGQVTQSSRSSALSPSFPRSITSVSSHVSSKQIRMCPVKRFAASLPLAEQRSAQQSVSSGGFAEVQQRRSGGSAGGARAGAGGEAGGGGEVRFEVNVDTRVEEVFLCSIIDFSCSRLQLIENW